jgi:hypothetical protein
MRHSFCYGSVLALVVATTVFVSPAEAQRAAGAFGGVLGAASDAEATHTLDVRGSLFGAWDDTLSRTDGDVPVDERFLRSGAAAGASGSLSHARRSQRFDWQSTAATALRVYGTQSEAAAATFNGDSTLNITLSRRVSMSAAGSFAYSPYYDFGPGLDGRLSTVGAFGGGFGVATAAQRNVYSTASSGLSYQMSRRDSFELNGGVRRYNFLDQDDRAIHTWNAGGRFNHTFTGNLGVHAGFGREQATYQVSGSEGATLNTIDVGVDYGDTLKFSRRTAFAFSTSTSAVRWDNATHYRLNGSASLTRGFGRSGSASLNYQRSTEFNAGFRDPLLTDVVSAGVNNQLGRRTAWSGQIGYMRGAIGFGSEAGHFDSYNAGGGLQFALTQRIGVFTDYSFYRYQVPAGSTVFNSLSRFSRQSVTAGLSVWMPLISAKRSSK